jgi:uncharacterized protein YkwD
MKPRESTDRTDLFPLLLALLLLIYLFYLLRPPLLMFWHYDLGMGQAENTTAVTPSTSPRTATATPPATAPRVIQPPSLPPTLAQPAATLPPAPPPPTAVDTINQEIERLTNQQRQTYNLRALSSDPGLRRIATRHSWDMLTRNYLDHISPDGIGPQQRVNQQHRRLFGTTGENVALITSPPTPPPQIAAEFVENWMNSPGHRRNILSGDFTHLANGCYQESKPPSDYRRCTQLFARVFAWADQDLPDTVQVGQTLTVRLRAAEGNFLPTRLLQVTLNDGREVSATPLTASGDTAVGQLTISGPPGLYGLQLYVPERADGSRYWTVPGPYLTVQ